MHYHPIVRTLEPTSLTLSLTHTAILTWIRLNRLSVSDLAAFVSMERRGRGLEAGLQTQHALSRSAALGREMIKC